MKETWPEHLAWCKERALKYVDRGDLKSAVASMAGDLKLWPDFKLDGHLVMIALMYVADYDSDGVKRWIKGFN